MIIPKKIILISLDTLRADHLGSYGYPRDTSPFIDEIARNGILFKNAFSASSFTIPSHASIFTGKKPSRHSIGFDQVKGRLNTDIDITLAEYLKAQGFKTAAFVSSFVLRKQTNLDSGFDLYDDEMSSHELNRPTELIRNGEETCDRAVRWIRENKDVNFFLFIHLFDIHGPYVCKEPYSSLFKTDSYARKNIKKLDLIVPDIHPIGGIPSYQVLNGIRDGNGILLHFEESVSYYISQYDGNIRYCDSIIENLVNNLKKLQIFDETLLIITSDHGEAFGENDIFFFHGLTVSPEQIHVPFIMSLPSPISVGNKIITEPVSTMDIFPTILSVFGEEAALYDCDGISLIKHDTRSQGSEDHERRIITSENEGQVATIYRDGIVKVRKKEYPSEPKMLYLPELIERLDNTTYNLDFTDSIKRE